LIPFFRASATRYTVYWHLFTRDEWTAHARNLAAAGVTRQRIERSTIDVVDADSQDSEKAHAGQGLQDQRRPWFEGRAGRESKAAPFGYTLKIATNNPVAVVTTCRGADLAPRTFDVLVDGTVIATDTLPLKPAALI